MNYVGDCVLSVLPRPDIITEDKHIRGLVAIDDISLLITDRDAGNVFAEKSNLRVGLLQVVCLEKIYIEEARGDDKKVETIDGKEKICYDKIESFQN